MSVKECLRQLQKEEIAAEIAFQEAREKEEQRQIEFPEEYAKLDEHRNNQAGLLEQLRKAGIVAILEEATEQPIPIPSNSFIHRLTIERTREWQVNMPSPKILEGGVWDDTLHINLVRSNRGISGGGVGFLIQGIASISYDVDKKLSIRGQEVTFTESLACTETPDLAVVEMGIAKAMFNPRLWGPSKNLWKIRK